MIIIRIEDKLFLSKCIKVYGTTEKMRLKKVTIFYAGICIHTIEATQH